jgi:hypothetical protein
MWSSFRPMLCTTGHFDLSPDGYKNCIEDTDYTGSVSENTLHVENRITLLDLNPMY